jgi:hypothetical protein
MDLVEPPYTPVDPNPPEARDVCSKKDSSTIFTTMGRRSGEQI